MLGLLLASNLWASSDSARLPLDLQPSCNGRIAGKARAQNATVSLALPHDVTRILQIADENRYSVIHDWNNGFLLGRKDLAEFSDAIERKLVYVVRDEVEIVGYAVVATLEDPMTSDDYEEARQLGLLDFLTKVPKLKWFAQSCIDRHHLHQGYGGILYRHVLSEFPEHSFGASVVLSAAMPGREFSNDASAAFHKKLGFEVLGELTYQYKNFDALTVGIHFRPVEDIE